MMNLHSTSKTCGKSRSLEYKQFETYGNLLSCQLSLNMLHCTEAHFHLVVLLPLPQTFPSPHISYRLSTSSHQVKGNGFSTCVLLELILKQVMLSENNKLVQTFFLPITFIWLQFSSSHYSVVRGGEQHYESSQINLSSRQFWFDFYKEQIATENNQHKNFHIK